MKLSDLIAPFSEPTQVECEVSGLANDSRAVEPGDLFMAYPGAQVDGRLFMLDAIQKGAVAVLYDPEDYSCRSETIPLIPITDLASKLGLIASRFYQSPSERCSVVGVTGTNGKTTIAYQLTQAHALLGHAAAYIGTLGEGRHGALRLLNNTTPDALALQHLFHTYHCEGIEQVCMEVSSHALCQGRVEGIRFNQAIFTNLTHDHLDYHHTMDAYAQAKAKLFAHEGLEWAIINQDDEASSEMMRACGLRTKILTYGIDSESDLRAISCQMTFSGTIIDVLTPWGLFKLKLKTIGQFNVYNALAVFSSLLISGYEPLRVVEVMARLDPSPGRMDIVAHGPTVLVDYAHTPDALEKALSTLQTLKQRKLVVVFGCGGDRDASKRPVMGRIASLLADEVILTSDNPRTENPESILQEILSGVTGQAEVHTVLDRKEAIHSALEKAHPDDLILIAGKGHEAYQQIGTVKYPFSDQDIVKCFFKR
ncbi:MAG: UDP-N-acetylmuramoyl-L-alanyl-D-glutamate--2,6-diaminopimelate ligase [Legionellaceae bacterium]